VRERADLSGPAFAITLRMISLSRYRLLAFSAALALLAAGCRSSIQQTVRPRPGLKLSAIGVYPFGFRWDEPAYRSFELSHRLIEVARKEVGEKLYLFGPPDFKVLRQGEDNAWAATTFLTLLPGVAVRPENAAVLRAWAEKNLIAQQGEVLDKRGRRIGQAVSQELSYVGHVEVIHPSSSEVLVEVTGTVKVDPFAEPPKDDSDPAPELTRLMEQLTARALGAVAEWAKAPGTPKPLGLTLGFNPKAAFSYAEDSRPSMELAMAAMDPVELELLTQSRIRFANPGISEAEVPKLAKMPGGLYVLSAEPPSQLARGDLIVRLDGEPALPQLLQRRRFAVVPIQAQVRRPSGELIEVLLP
jgi:hypothetical protein